MKPFLTQEGFVGRYRHHLRMLATWYTCQLDTTICLGHKTYQVRCQVRCMDPLVTLSAVQMSTRHYHRIQPYITCVVWCNIVRTGTWQSPLLNKQRTGSLKSPTLIYSVHTIDFSHTEPAEYVFGCAVALHYGSLFALWEDDVHVSGC